MKEKPHFSLSLLSPEMQIHLDTQSPSTLKYRAKSSGKQVLLFLSRALMATEKEKFLHITPGPSLEKAVLYAGCNSSLT